MPRLQTDVRIKQPRRAVCGTARGNLAAFGAAVNFEQRRVEASLGGARQILRKRGGRRYHQRNRRQRLVRHRQRAQMHR
jgi:hypothetical protein